MSGGVFSPRSRFDDARGASSPRSPRAATQRSIGSASSSMNTVNRSRPPREKLYVKRSVPLAEFARDVHNGTVAGYPQLHVAERLRLFGSSVVPIFVPLAPGETEDQYEARFVDWVQRIHGYSLQELERNSDEKMERFFRMRFATANARGTAKFDPSEMKAESVRDRREECGDRNHRSSEGRDHYYFERRRSRSRSRSPVRSSSSRGSYDQRRYGGHLRSRETSDHHHQQQPPRTSLSLTQSTETKSSSKEPPRYGRHPTTCERVPREALYAKKYVELDQFVIDYRQGRISNYAKLSDHKKQELFGSTIMPIFVPLARGESMRQYEERFVKWIRGEGYSTLRELETHVDEMCERYLRIKFAKHNATGLERFIPSESKPESKRDRPQTDESPRPAKKVARVEEVRPSSSTTKPINKESNHVLTPSDKPSHREYSKPDEILPRSAGRSGCSFISPPEGASISAVANAYIACECRPCLVKGMRFLTGKVADLTGKDACQTSHTKSSEAEIAQRRVVDLTQDEIPQSPKQKNPNRFALAITKLVTSNTIVDELSQQLELTRAANGDGIGSPDDPVEKQLLDEYEQINKTVVTHEKALSDLPARLVATPVTDITETTRLQDKSQTLRSAIHLNSNHRSAALAMVIAHMWRHNKEDLKRQIDSDSTKNVLHIQRTSHKKCSALAAEIAAIQEKAESVKHRLGVAMKVSSSADEDPGKHLKSLTRLGLALAEAERELRDLLGQRRQQFATLIEFDQQLRLLIRTVLARST